MVREKTTHAMNYGTGSFFYQKIPMECMKIKLSMQNILLKNVWRWWWWSCFDNRWTETRILKFFPNLLLSPTATKTNEMKSEDYLI